MQRQSRSLGDELWRSEQCQNEAHFVASDGRRASIIAGNVTALLQLASALQAASKARFARENDPSEASKRRVLANQTKRQVVCARGDRGDREADRVDTAVPDENTG